MSWSNFVYERFMHMKFAETVYSFDNYRQFSEFMDRGRFSLYALNNSDIEVVKLIMPLYAVESRCPLYYAMAFAHTQLNGVNALRTVKSYMESMVKEFRLKGKSPQLIDMFEKAIMECCSAGFPSAPCSSFKPIPKWFRSSINNPTLKYNICIYIVENLVRKAIVSGGGFSNIFTTSEIVQINIFKKVWTDLHENIKQKEGRSYARS